MCGPLCMRSTIAIKKDERERNAHPFLEREREIWLAREQGSDGGAPSRMEEEVCNLACQARVLVWVEVKREVPQALH